jgi:hypothetical protein
MTYFVLILLIQSLKSDLYVTLKVHLKGSNLAVSLNIFTSKRTLEALLMYLHDDQRSKGSHLTE